MNVCWSGRMPAQRTNTNGPTDTDESSGPQLQRPPRPMLTPVPLPYEGSYGSLAAHGEKRQRVYAFKVNIR